MKLKPLHCVIVIVCLTLAPQLSFAAEFETDSLTAAGGFPGVGNRQAWLKACELYNQALRQRKLGNRQGAITLYRKAIRLYPQDPDFHLNFAIDLIQFDSKSEEAERHINTALALDPTNFNTRIVQAMILVKKGKIKEAKSCFKELQERARTADEIKLLKGTRENMTKRSGVAF